jgi:AcrR family transcriptional regulator
MVERRRRPASPQPKTDGRHARRVRTEARLLSVVGRLLRRGGIQALAINTIAAKAGVDKVLIYRYFGGLEGLVAAYAASGEFWPTIDEILGDGRQLAREPDRARAAARILVNYARALRSRPLTLDLLGWELSQHNAVVAAMQAVREERSREILATLAAAGFPLGDGLAELGALLSAAMNYLALRARQLSVFSGLPIGKDADWDHIEDVIASVIRRAWPALDESAESSKATRSRRA